MEEGKQTLHAGRARVSYSELKLCSGTLWTAGLAFCELELFSAQMNVGWRATQEPLTPTYKNKDMDRYKSGWSVESSGRTITNKRSVEGEKKKR